MKKTLSFKSARGVKKKTPNREKKTNFSEDEVFNEGERILESEGGSLYREHAQRYYFALKHIQPNEEVLDCACGTGYGTKILSGKAKKVTGVDISPAAVAYCKKNYQAENLEFERGSAESLKIRSGSLDVFTSFETIEHIPHPEKLVREAKRVLRPGGKFIVSTPNRIVTGLKSGERPSNPFHLMEWSLLEFDAILRRDFSKIHYFGQRIRSKNILHPIYVFSKFKKITGQGEILRLKADERLIQQLELEKGWQPTIFIAVCEK
jgi:ubiquinone/menaquinone biosynthesis C-methylase UbiE